MTVRSLPPSYLLYSSSCYCLRFFSSASFNYFSRCNLRSFSLFLLSFSSRSRRAFCWKMKVSIYKHWQLPNKLPVFKFCNHLLVVPFPSIGLLSLLLTWSVSHSYRSGAGLSPCARTLVLRAIPMTSCMLNFVFKFKLPIFLNLKLHFSSKN